MIDLEHVKRVDFDFLYYNWWRLWLGTVSQLPQIKTLLVVKPAQAKLPTEEANDPGFKGYEIGQIVGVRCVKGPQGRANYRVWTTFMSDRKFEHGLLVALSPEVEGGVNNVDTGPAYPSSHAHNDAEQQIWIMSNDELEENWRRLGSGKVTFGLGEVDSQIIIAKDTLVQWLARERQVRKLS